MVIQTFEKLDEKILGVYKQINQWSHKKFGATKYDLSRICDLGAMVTLAGGAVYNSILGFNIEENKASYFILAGISALSSFAFYGLSKREKEDEKKEMEYLTETGTAFAPSANPYRAFTLCAYLSFYLLYTLGQSILHPNRLENLYGLPLEHKTFLYYSTDFLVVSSLNFWYSSSYFRDCTLFPRKKGRQKLWQKIKNYFRPKASPAVPIPQEQEIRYTALEEIVRSEELPKFSPLIAYS